MDEPSNDPYAPIPSTEISDAERTQREARYCMWRMGAWLEGHGTYQEIDAKVERGELTPN